ncbi:hypothetical protein ONS95_007053 [Cadophora gregata]|uniref:uncharacterized protein n=1 Tax=Cadophora gregata TaxID=51156 RepID=UPI0026DBA9BD|nr:uncharacterized protein ONS95_007053 [Cadophora gregata]KAK0100598.1 hypothetical protein ONS95_007053 [Cadophora gregata]KAK0117406.1 hypothetical protein ONS96_013236 [Cadophora gregata f. sp. sojae]
MADSELKSNDTSSPTSNPGDSDISPPSALPFLSQDVDLEILPEPLQLSHGTTEHISTVPFRKCSISTKITDLRRCWFRDERVGGDGKREACVVVFELEFGEQSRESGQRITEMGVWVLVEEVDEDERQTTKQQQAILTPPITQAPSPDLAIKAIYPYSASSPLTPLLTTTSLSTSLSPTFNNISILSLSASQEKSHTSHHGARLTTTSAGTQGRKLQLSENALLKSGVPDRVRFAVLLQTDGLPFDVELRFKGVAGSSKWGVGVKVGAKCVVGVGSEYLWFRRGEGEGEGGSGSVREGEVRFDEDADSEVFRRWVFEKTGNAWAEGVVWE